MSTHASANPAPGVLEQATAMKVAFAAILYFAVRISFGYDCSSSGCTPPMVPLVAAAAALAVQVLLLIPLDVRQRRTLGESWALRAAIWTMASLAAFGVPMLVWWLDRPTGA